MKKLLKNYESEATKFIKDFLKKNPEVKVNQKQAREFWWDRPQDVKTIKKFYSSKINKKPYEYY